jgi:hypothetical protein
MGILEKNLLENSFVHALYFSGDVFIIVVGLIIKIVFVV